MPLEKNDTGVFRSGLNKRFEIIGCEPYILGHRGKWFSEDTPEHRC